MNDDTRAPGPGGRIHGPGSAPMEGSIADTMEAQEDALETTGDTDRTDAVDPETLRFGVAPRPADAESTIAPSPMDRPVGPAAARQNAQQNPQRPDPDLLRNVEAGTDEDMMPP